MQINRAYFGISNTPGAAGDLTVGAAVAGPYRTLGAAQNGQSFEVSIVDGNAWEIRTGCTYNSGTNTLTRGTLEDSSTGSAIALTSAALVMVTATGSRLTRQFERGIVVARNDGTTTQSIAASTFTLLTVINAEERDANGWWNGSRFQPTQAGLYQISMGTQVSMAMASAGQVTSVIGLLRKNGVDFAHVARGWVYQDVATAAKNVGVSGAVIVYLNGSTDFVEPFVWHNDTAARSTAAGAERQFFMATFLAEQ